MIARGGGAWRSRWVSAVTIIGPALWLVAASAAGTVTEPDQAGLSPALPVSSLLDFAAGQSVFWGLVALVLLQSLAIAFLCKRLQRQGQEETRQEDLNRNLERRIHEELEKSLEKDRLMLQQSRFAAMGEMIGNIAHQWRQPLNMLGIVIQQMQMEQEKGVMTDRLMEERVEKGMDLLLYLSRTIDDFRNFFRPETEAAPFRLAGAVAKTVGFFEASCVDHGITIRVKGDTKLVYNGHANQFAQALLNILNNARDALVDSKTEQPTIVISMLDDGQRSIVTISDNAGGIDAQIMDKIFDPYFTTKEEGKGTGIGLYMAKTIIDRNMQGQILVRNVADGAEFKIVI
jgi:signal transduction histidine kinase